ncbi:MAG: 3'-5' exonuclease [Polyangiaceae bacterium]|nr:3'-5' exonuclease [Polyangiaceae bacterium]
MTGLDVKNDRILEICIERVVGQRVEKRLETFVDPEQPFPPSVHGITPSDLVGAPRFQEVAEELKSILDGAVFVAHGAKWDVDFLRAAFARAKSDATIHHWIDTLHLSRRAFFFESHSLENLCREHGIPYDTKHRAAADVHALRAVFDLTVAKLEPSCARDLWGVRAGGEPSPRPEIVAACERAIASGETIRVVYRATRRPSQEFQMVLRGMETTSPQRVFGYDRETFSRRELRLDRILSVGDHGHTS